MAAPLNPPFRAEHIGSLLRSEALTKTRADHAAGKVSDEELRAAEDQEAIRLIAYQRDLGFSAVTDGEVRRAAYSDSFTLDSFSGVRIDSTEDSNWTYTSTSGEKTEARVPVVFDRLIWPGPVNVENYNFIAEHADGGIGKITLPGPCYIHFRSGRDNIDKTVYPDLDIFWSDLVEAYVKELAALHDAGCRYVQLDETSIAKLGDPKIRAGLADRGDKWEDLLSLYTDVINQIVDRAPGDMAIGIHLCRGNKASSWQAEGGYDDVSSNLFRELRVKFYFLEYDSPRAGTFEPLQNVPNDKTVILGLVSTKTQEMEEVDYLKRRIEEAAQFVDIDRLGISPQCGFASADIRNASNEESQRAKLIRIVDLAREIWNYEPLPRG